MKQMLILLSIFLVITGCQSQPTPSLQSQYETLIAAASTSPSPQNDANSGKDAACDYENPLMIEYGEVKGSFAIEDKEDCYAVLYSTGDILKIQIQASEYLYLYPNLHIAGDYIDIEDPVNSIYELEVSRGRDSNHSGDVLVRIDLTGIGIGEYVMTINRSAQNDAGAGRDAPFKQKEQVLSAGTYTGFVGHGDECDEYFYEALEETQSLTMTVTPAANLDASIMWWGGTSAAPGINVVELLFHSSDTQAAGGMETYTFPAGMIRPSFGVCAMGGTAGEYSFTIER